MYIYIYKCIIIILINSVTAAISFGLNVVGDLPDLQALPHPCSIKNKADSDNIELDDNDNNSNNNNKNNNNNNNDNNDNNNNPNNSNSNINKSRKITNINSKHFHPFC